MNNSNYAVKPVKKKFKKIKILIVLILIVVAGYFALNHYLHKDNVNLEQINDYLTQENDELRSFVFGVCQLNGFSADYYFVEGQNCQHFFEEIIQDFDQGINVETGFIDFINTFYTSTDNEDLQKQVLLIEDYSESKAIQTQEEIDVWAQFVELSQKEDIVNYLADFSLTLEEKDADEYLLKQNDEVVADIYFDSAKDILVALMLPDENKVRLDNFSNVKNQAQYALQAFNDYNLDSIATVAEEQLDAERFMNVLLLGKHEKNVDTIMLATIDFQKERVTLVSLPRDLWVDNRKINSYYYLFGIDGFIKKVESLTGQQISNYILIDMYAFPEVVDKLGGVDYYFDYPLIDPTYVTNDNGVEGTLYFPTGEAHLNGIQALRVARSRHTTSDFGRAARQQKIIASVQDKMKDASKKDLSSLIPTVLKKVDTDFDLSDLMTLALKVKDYEVRSDNVISTGNILTSTYFEFGADKKEGEESADSQTASTGQRAYILIPLEDDWSLIKKYIVNAIYRD